MSVQAVIGMQNNNAAAGDAAAPPSGGTANGSAAAGRNPMGGSQPQTPAPAASDSAQAPEQAQRPPINGQTQGVIGISNVTLAPGSGAQGSVLTSEKNNVKLEEGTMLLLKVNP